MEGVKKRISGLTSKRIHLYQETSYQARTLIKQETLGFNSLLNSKTFFMVSYFLTYETLKKIKILTFSATV